MSQASKGAPASKKKTWGRFFLLSPNLLDQLTYLIRKASIYNNMTSSSLVSKTRFSQTTPTLIIDITTTLSTRTCEDARFFQGEALFAARYIRNFGGMFSSSRSWAMYLNLHLSQAPHANILATDALHSLLPIYDVDLLVTSLLNMLLSFTNHHRLPYSTPSFPFI